MLGQMVKKLAFKLKKNSKKLPKRIVPQKNFYYLFFAFIFFKETKGAM